MLYKFRSVLFAEMNEYLELLRAAGRYTAQIESSLKSLDCYLVKHNEENKILATSLITGWLTEKAVKNITKAGILSNVKGFARYLSSFGIKWDIPEYPIVENDYIYPVYIFLRGVCQNCDRC